MDITIYHNAGCSSSRTALGLIRNTGVEPTIVDYLANPPSHSQLKAMIASAGLTVRDALRPNEAVFSALGLDNPALADDVLIDAMLAHPILMNRPFVVTSQGVRLCRPVQRVLEILPLRQLGAFNKENGEAVIDANGELIKT
jgi:arsenate reductase